MVHTIAMKLKWPLVKENEEVNLGLRHVLTHSAADMEKNRGLFGSELCIFQSTLAFGQSLKACIIFSVATPHFTQVESTHICHLTRASLVFSNKP